ncbi:MAG: hypothetical protein AB7S38_41435 [Vulcanimicrobiota bacterium]
MNCERVQQLLTEQRQEAPAEVFAHLEECSDCQRQHAERSNLFRELAGLPSPALADDFAERVAAQVHSQPSWWLPNRRQRPAEIRHLWPAAALALAGCSLVGAADLAWQTGRIPGFEYGIVKDSLVVPGVPTVILVLVLLVNWVRSLRLGDLHQPLSTGRMLGLLTAVTALPHLGFAAIYAMTCYGSFYERPEGLLATTWPLALVPILFWWMGVRRLQGGVPAAAITFYGALGLAALSCSWAWQGRHLLEGFLRLLGVPQMYYLRHMLEAPQLMAWLVLTGVGLTVLASTFFEVVVDLRPSLLAGLVLGLVVLGGARLDLLGLVSHPGEEPAHVPMKTQLWTRPLTWVESDGVVDSPPPQSLYASVFINNDLRQAEMSRWEPLPGFAEALPLLEKMRPARRGWWGTGPAGIPGLAPHPDFLPQAQRARQLLPDNQAIEEWYQLCLNPPAGRLHGRLLHADGQPLAGARLRLLSGGEDAAERTLRTEVGYWGWTALRVTETDSQGRFEFTSLEPGSYVLASRLPLAVTNPPGTVTVGEQSVDLGGLRLEQP